MGMLLAFSPFLAFALLDQLISPLIGLIAGAVVALVLLARDTLISKRPAKILEVGTALLFTGLAICFWLVKPVWSIVQVRLVVDAWLLLVVGVSLAVGRPCTLAYARKRVPREQWTSASFIRTNVLITTAWLLAVMVLVAADAVMAFLPTIPHLRALGIAATVVALVGACKFTGWYPEHVRANAPRPATTAA